MANIEVNGETFAVNPQDFSVLSLLPVLGIEGGDADKIAQNFQDRLTRPLDEDFVALLKDYLPNFADRYVGVGNSGRYRLRHNGEEILANLIVALLAPLQPEGGTPAPIDPAPIAPEPSNPKGFADKKPVTKIKTPQPLVTASQPLLATPQPLLAAPQQLTPVAANTTLGFENLTQEQLRAILQTQLTGDQMEDLEG